MASEDDHLHLSCESNDFEDKTLPKKKKKKEEKKKKKLVNNMVYSRISLNHIQQKTNLLSIAVIRKRRRWSANMAAACIVSSGEHFCCCFLRFLFFHLGTF